MYFTETVTGCQLKPNLLETFSPTINAITSILKSMLLCKSKTILLHFVLHYLFYCTRKLRTIIVVFHNVYSLPTVYFLIFIAFYICISTHFHASSNTVNNKQRMTGKDEKYFYSDCAVNCLQIF